MADQGKNHRQSHVEYVNCSQASHRDAKPPAEPKFETYEDEFNWLRNRIKEIDFQLSTCSGAAKGKAQLEIRKRFAGNPSRSIEEWIRTKAQMEDKRNALIVEKNEYEDRYQRIKPRVKQEKQAAHLDATSELVREDGIVNFGPVALKILEELKRIRIAVEGSSMEGGK